MRVWLDGQCLQTASKVRGIGRYVREFIQGISESTPDVELSISFNAAMPDQAIFARDFVRRWIAPENIHVWQGCVANGEVVERYTPERQLSELALAHHVACLRPDVAISTSVFEGEHDRAVPLMPNTIVDFPVASIFYDAIPFRFPEVYLPSQHARDSYSRRLAAFGKFDLNLCISDFSKAESIALSGNKRAINISAGVSQDIVHFSSLAAPNRRMAGQDFVLYVGALDWRKNIAGVIEAFQLLPPAEVATLRLAIVGDQDAGRLADATERWAASGLPADGFVNLGHVSDEELVSLYRAARLVVQPSLMEGFGLTALEAIYCGAPAIGSSTGAIPEIITNPRLRFDPKVPSEIAACMQLVLNDAPFRRTSSAEARVWAAQFTWKRTAETAIQALRDLGDKRTRKAARGLAGPRARSAVVAGQLEVAPEIVAGMLARAEPVQPAARRLIVDATTTIIEDHKTGIQRVVKKICENLEGDGGEAVIGYCDWDQQWYAPRREKKSSGLPPLDKRPSSKLDIRPDDCLVMLDSSWEFHTKGYSSLHSARLRGAEVISCVYDLVPLRSPAFCHPGMPPAFASWVTAALGYSSGFICISRAVADEMLALLTAIEFPRPMKVGYWRLGADFLPLGQATSPAHAPRHRPSFLMVGTIEPRKGYAVALDAFERLWAEGVDVELVIVGKPGWGNECLIDRLLKHKETGKRLHWESRVTDAELIDFYRRSDALVTSSFGEGFGLPVVEAGYFGKPIIASDLPVFREVTAGAGSAHFFAVGSSTELAEAVRRLAMTEGRGAPPPRNADWPSWRQSAADLKRVVLEDNWYQTYEPASPRPYPSIFDKGAIEMTHALPAADRSHIIELVEGPIPIDKGHTSRYIVRIANTSSRVWSSRGAKGEKLGIFIGAGLVDAKGRSTELEASRVTIPLVIIPGDAHYAAIEVPAAAHKSSRFLEIGLQQESVGWWDGALRLAL